MQAQSYKKEIPSQSRNGDSVTHENNPLHCEQFTHGLFLWSKAVPMKTGQWGLWIIQNNRDTVSGKTHSRWSCINNFFATWRQWNKLSTSSGFDCCVISIVTILSPSDATVSLELCSCSNDESKSNRHRYINALLLSVWSHKWRRASSYRLEASQLN